MDSKSSSRTDSDDILDVFSPLKRKDVESDDPFERKIRLREAAVSLGKQTKKSVADADGRLQKSTNGPTRHAELRIKEREMEAEAAKALLAKKESLGTLPEISH